MGGFFGMQGASSLGCGNNWTGPSETQQIRTSLPGQRTGTLKMQRTMASPLPPPPAPEEPRPQMGRMDLGKEISCTTCEAKKKALRDAGWNPPATTTRMMGGHPIGNSGRRPFMGRKSYEDDTDLGCASCGLEGARRQAAALGQVCARTKPVGLNCQKTASGDVICSDGILYSGECPNAPEANLPGIAEVNPGTNVAKTPTAPGATPILPIPPAAAAGALPAAPADSGMNPLAIGAVGLVGLGLLYAILK